MENKTQTMFNASEFCSRKLYELVALSSRGGTAVALSAEERNAALAELTQRRHYLTELKDRGLIERQTQH